MAPKAVLFSRALAVIFLIAMSSFLRQEARADSTIYVEPLVDIFILEIDETHRGEFTVSNPGEQLKIVELALVDFDLDERGSVSIHEAGVFGPYSICQHVDVHPQTFSLLPGASRFVQYDISVPDEAVPHWGGIVVRQQSGEDERPTGFVLHLETQFLFAMVQLPAAECSGEPSWAEVDEFDWTENESGGVLALEIRLGNESDCIVRAHGLWNLIHAAGDLLGTGTSSSFTLLPRSQRIVKVRIPVASLEPGEYELRYSITPLRGETVVGQMILLLDEISLHEDSP